MTFKKKQKFGKKRSFKKKDGMAVPFPAVYVKPEVEDVLDLNREINEMQQLVENAKEEFMIILRARFGPEVTFGDVLPVIPRRALIEAKRKEKEYEEMLRNEKFLEDNPEVLGDATTINRLYALVHSVPKFRKMNEDINDMEKKLSKLKNKRAKMYAKDPALEVDVEKIQEELAASRMVAQST